MNSPYNGKFRVTQQFKGASHDGLDLVGLDSKEVHSTVNGVVEIATWENSANKKQGFGLYVRIRQDGSVDRYYYGHLSKITVSVGQRVKIGDIIGIEGSTGYSTGSHCHYCVRANAIISQFKDVSAISGIPNQLGVYDDGYRPTPQIKKSVAELAQEVLNGLWSNGNERRNRLTAAGYNYAEVQAEVNRLVAGKNPTTIKSNEELASEVIKGLWGNGAERKQRLTDAGYNYSAIQKIVNERLS